MAATSTWSPMRPSSPLICAMHSTGPPPPGCSELITCSTRTWLDPFRNRRRRLEDITSVTKHDIRIRVPKREVTYHFLLGDAIVVAGISHTPHEEHPRLSAILSGLLRDRKSVV